MLFDRKSSPSSQRKTSQERPRHPRSSSDGRRSFSDVFRKSQDVVRPRMTEKHITFLGKTVIQATLPTVPGQQTTRPPYTSRFSEDIARTSISTRTTPRPSEDTIRKSSQHVRDGSGEFRTTKGESFTLFPKSTVRLMTSSMSMRSRTSMDSEYNYDPNTKRAVPDRFSESIRSSKRKLKHSASKLSLVSSIDEMDELDKSRLLKAACDIHGSRRCKCDTGLICRISEPLDFRHVTHAMPKQFTHAMMKERNQSDLVADFSAVRASQIARLDLRGIKAQDLQSARSSFDTAPSPTRSNVPSLVSSSSHDSLQSTRPSSQASQDSFIPRRPKENFSRPFFYNRPTRIESLSAPRSSTPTTGFRSFSKPFYASSVSGSDVSDSPSARTVHITHALSPLEELTRELEQWSPSFAPELPVVDELAEMECAQQTMVVPTTSTPYPSRFPSPARRTPIVVATDRDDPEAWDIGLDRESLKVPPLRPSADVLRISMLRSSVTNGMCTSWALDNE